MKDMIRKDFCIKIKGETSIYSPNKIIDGYARPYAEPHMWVSDDIKDKSEWIELQWETNICVKEIHVTFNADVNEDIINLHHHYTDFPVVPELVKNYNIAIWQDNKWKIIITKKDNRERKLVFKIIDKLETCKLRIIIETTNGSKRAEIVEVRVY